MVKSVNTNKVEMDKKAAIAVVFERFDAIDEIIKYDDVKRHRNGTEEAVNKKIKNKIDKE